MSETSAASFVVNTLLLKGSLVLAMGGVLISISRRTSASHRHWIGCLTFACLFLLVALPVFSPSLHLGVLPVATPEVFETSVPLTPLSAIPEAVPNASTPPSHPPAPPETFNWIGELWFFGFLVLLGKILVDLGMLCWVSSKGKTFLDRNRKITSECLSRLRWEHSVKCIMAPHVRVPMAWGFRRPTVLIPESATSWSKSKLRTVLLHEIGHLKRRDQLTTLFVQIVCALYWVNPFVWMVMWLVNREREHACDELVLNTGTDRISYANQLVELARTLLPGGANAGAAMAFQGGLKARVQRILDFQANARKLNSSALVIYSVLSLSFIVPISLCELTESRASASLEALIEDLEGGSMEERKRAAWSLGEREDPRAVEALLATLEDPNPELRGLTAWALGEIKDQQAVARLIEAVEDEDIYAREMIVRALGEIEDPRAVTALLRAMQDEEASVRSAAVWSLGEIGTKDSIYAVSGAMNDHEPLVQAEAMRVIVESEKGAALQPMIEALSDPEPAVRMEAVRALGRIGDPRAVEPLIKMLRDNDAGIRTWAVWALDEIEESR